MKIGMMMLLVTVVMAGCSTEIGGETGRDPFAIDTDTVSADLRQNILNRRAIFVANELASDAFEDAVNLRLGELGLPVIYVDVPMTPDETRDGEVMHMDGSTHDPVDPAAAMTGSATSCPWAAAEPAIDPSSVSCRFLANDVQERAETRAAQRFAETPITGEFVEDAPDPEQVVDWYETAFNFGVGWSPDVLIGAMRTAGACDTVPTPVETAHERGVAAGRALMRQIVADQEAGAPRDRCDTDNTIVDPSYTLAEALTAETAAENELCPGYVAPGAAERNRLVAAESELLEGIQVGIREQGREESARLVREFVCTPPPVTGGGGDPLVLDLDGNGVHVDELAYGPMFDFGDTGLVRTQWILGDAFVVLDRNDDRQIEATELFGDISVTEDGERAADGLRALELYDHASRGGNGDGQIDSRDAVYARLELWQDVDGDARTDRGELRTLRRSGVSAINLSSERWIDGEGREHTAADVWFRYGR